MKADAPVALRDVAVRYGRHIALEGVTGQFAPGSMTAVVGANGAGKTTLLAAIAGTVRLARGIVDRRACGRLAYLPQLADLDRDYPITVEELITLGAWQEIGGFAAPSPVLRDKARSAAVGLTDRLKRRIGELSVGELQRALFARLTLQDASVILLDEPFAPVDAQTTSLLLDQVRQWSQEGRTVIAALHDLDLVRESFPSTVVLAGRCLAWGKTNEALRALTA